MEIFISGCFFSFLWFALYPFQLSFENIIFSIDNWPVFCSFKHFDDYLCAMWSENIRVIHLLHVLLCFPVHEIVRQLSLFWNNTDNKTSVAHRNRQLYSPQYLNGGERMQFCWGKVGKTLSLMQSISGVSEWVEEWVWIL